MPYIDRGTPEAWDAAIAEQAGRVVLRRRAPAERLAEAWPALFAELDQLLADPRVDRAARLRILGLVVTVGMAVDELRPEPTAPPSFTCPRCRRTSHNPNDVREGYCGACHDWTGADAGAGWL